MRIIDRGYKKMVYDELDEFIGIGEERFPETMDQIAEYAERIFVNKANGISSIKNERHLHAQIEGLRLDLGLDNTRDILSALTRAASAATQIMEAIGRL